jgi:glutathione S-transferase
MRAPHAILTLYFAPGAGSMAPHIALHEVGADFDARPISFRHREHRVLGYLALNPEGKVLPTLLIEGRPLTEVAAVLFYLARAYPGASLLPEGEEAEAHAVSRMSFAASTLHPARRRGLEHAMTAWRIADQKLGTQNWVTGQYSIADIHLFRLFWRMNASLKPEAGTLPNLTAHHDRMLERAAVKRTIAMEAEIGYELPA